MFRRTSAIAALIVVLGGATLVRATSQATQHSPKAGGFPADLIAAGPDGPGARRPGMGWLQDLNLSAEQMQRIQAVRTQYRDRIQKARQAERQGQQELRSLMTGTASKAEVLAKYRQVKTLREQATDAQFESMVDMRDIMTPEQRQKLAERMRQQRGNMMMRGPKHEG